MINKLQFENIKNIDLDSLSNLILEQEYKNYFLEVPGKEHYKLLAYISTLYNNQTLLDIGTYKGCSAIALSHNPLNKVISFDVIIDSVRLKSKPSNVEFKVDNILNEEYKHLILNSPFILLDTAHTGPFEYEFYEYLKSIDYVGILILDDIYLNDAMIGFWKYINHEKHDISEFGHHSGTGIVIF
jgi:hypothetical protein